MELVREGVAQQETGNFRRTKVLSRRFAGDSLLVFIPDQLSDLIRKGEITERYYNPGELFKEVHLVLVNDDKPDPLLVQKTVGSAKLHIHNISVPKVFQLFSRYPFLLGYWTRKAIRLAEQVQPQLIRCHSNRLNAYFASQIKNKMGTPFVISMHINPDLDIRPFLKKRLLKQLYYWALRPIEAISIRNADAVISVYRFIVPYLKNLGSRNTKVIYNVINPSQLRPKVKYQLSNPIRVINIGRQFEQKNPAPLIEAVGLLPEVDLTLIGTGEYSGMLRQLADKLGIEKRCHFLPSLSNDELCAGLKDFDIFVSVNDYGGVSKVELEAAQVGMPMITNSHPFEAEPEVLGKNCLVVEGSVGSYVKALQQLISDSKLREALGIGLRNSVSGLIPDEMESDTVDLYESLRKKK